uniref:Uncharacterized protein n=1 Tax=Astyanax mexicanus TaxID=7994 RepID=A0A3B1IHR6_ASTMX
MSKGTRGDNDIIVGAKVDGFSTSRTSSLKSCISKVKWHNKEHLGNEQLFVSLVRADRKATVTQITISNNRRPCYVPLLSAKNRKLRTPLPPSKPAPSAPTIPLMLHTHLHAAQLSPGPSSWNPPCSFMPPVLF